VLVTGVTLALAVPGAAGGCDRAGEAEKANATTRPAASAGSAASVPAEFKPHEVASGEFRFKAPAAWKKAEKPGSMAVMTLFIDEQRSSLRVNAMDVAPGTGLQQTVAASEAQIPKANKNFKHAKTEYFQAGGAQAARVMFDVTARGQNLKVMQVLLSHGKKMYGLTFTAAADKFPSLAPTFDQVIASAEFP
jgi:hypothetical protein